jgi:uncharacterized protein
VFSIDIDAYMYRFITSRVAIHIDKEATMAGKRGFASMDPERQREIASMGGKHAHAIGKAHKYNTETGKVAGKMGGQRPRARSKK